MSTTKVLIAVVLLCGGLNAVCAPDDDPDVINPHPYHLVLNHPRLCRKSSEQEVDLLMMIISAPDKFERRSAIRHSWGLVAAASPRRKRLFLLGLPSSEEVQGRIREENALYRDILQEDFVDCYKNLSLKTMMMLKWALHFCAHARFLLKIDDDVILNPDNLFKVLERTEPQVDEALITGLIYREYEPHRSNLSKYFVSSEEYPDEEYPDFVVGPAYLYTRGALPVLYETALRTRPIVLEDVFFNGIVAARANVTLVQDENFCSFKKMSACNLFEHVVAYHGLEEHNKMALVWWIMNNNRMDYCKNAKDKKVRRLAKLINRKKLVRYKTF